MASVLQTLSNDLANVVETAGQSIVRVEARRRLSASGVVWSADGIIVTSHHVVEREDDIQIGLSDGGTVSASLVGRDPTTDLAILKTEATDLAPAAWVATDELAVGHLVLALGRPGRTVQATLGVVSALGSNWRTPAGGEIDRYLQTDVVMYPGFSGGPLATAGGQIAGINSSALLRGTSIAIPTATIQSVVESLLTHGKMPRGYLGVGIQPVQLPDALQQELNQSAGLMLMSIEANSPASTAGLLQGDILVSLDDHALQQMEDLQNLLG
ncbi:MAG: trypsin-like peptidase domain-containing protein, partial [Caldilineaceae bacterium]|nr:trypsin-like peptidase domain-containing protein [Caldilineaceae bacterium]